MDEEVFHTVFFVRSLLLRGEVQVGSTWECNEFYTNQTTEKTNNSGLFFTASDVDTVRKKQNGHTLQNVGEETEREKAEKKERRIMMWREQDTWSGAHMSEACNEPRGPGLRRRTNDDNTAWQYSIHSEVGNNNNNSQPF